MPSDVFFDTNVVLYTLSADPLKQVRSAQLLRAGGVVSVQVLNETVRVARAPKKMGVTWPEVHTILAGVQAKCAVVPLTLQVHQRGLAYAERYQYTIFDSMIVAAAVEAGCTTLYSEDMNDGQVIDGLTIRNPYVGL
jgi:predicted nucleic acid-binding protein